MNYRRLGRAGLQVSELSFGSWVTFHNQADLGLAIEMLAAAYEAGVNFFDNAEVYAAGTAEKIMGEVLKKKGWRRSEFVISTKIFWGGPGPNQRGLSRKHVVEGVLQTDIACRRSDDHRQLGLVVHLGAVFAGRRQVYRGTGVSNGAGRLHETGRRRRGHVFGEILGVGAVIEADAPDLRRTAVSRRFFERALSMHTVVYILSPGSG